MIIDTTLEFTKWFNEKFSRVNRKITLDDVRLMTEGRLIGKYSYYTKDDGETVRGILLYEQMRPRILEKVEMKPVNATRRCKKCGRLLPYLRRVRKGRHKEYCRRCNPVRLRERHRRWILKKRLKI